MSPRRPSRSERNADPSRSARSPAPLRSERDPASSRSTLLAGGRRRLGPVLGLAFALLLLAALEGILRLAGVAQPEPLLRRVQSGSLDVYALNDQVGARYFPPSMERFMPRPGFRIFPAVKEPGTVRIFVLGASTAAGFPYHTHAAFSGFLEDRLNRLVPGRRFEVVNCAMTAINSYAVLDFLRELTRREPDLFVVYLGHNEYYGALGPGSGVSPARHPAVLRFLRSLLDLRLSRLMQSILDAARTDPEPVRRQTVMEAMVGQTGIRPGDRLDQAALEGFEHNLRAMVRSAGDTPILFCTVASNLRDQPPFGPTNDPSLDGEAAVRFRDGWGRVDALVRSGLPDGAAPARETTLRAIRDLAAIDSTHSGARYLQAAADEEAGRLEAALRGYRAARDFDGIPFRAPGRINQVIRQVAAAEGALLVEAESLMTAASAGGIPGSGLFFEHVHPRPEGNQIVADGVLRRIRQAGLFMEPGDWRWERDLDFGAYRGLAGITPLDDELADQRIFHLTHKWPFPDDPAAQYRTAADSLTARLARDVLEHRLDLAEAHHRRGVALVQEGRLEEGFQEFRTLCRIYPVVPERFADAARILLDLGRSEEAGGYLSRALELDPGNADYIGLLQAAGRMKSGSSP